MTRVMVVLLSSRLWTSCAPSQGTGLAGASIGCGCNRMNHPVVVVPLLGTALTLPEHAQGETQRGLVECVLFPARSSTTEAFW